MQSPCPPRAKSRIRQECYAIFRITLYTKENIMMFLKIAGDFLLSAWIWNITFDWVHIVIAAIIMIYLLWFVMKRRLIEAVLLALGAQLFAFAFLSLLVVFICGHLIGCYYEPIHAHEAVSFMHIFLPSLWIGIIYATIQSGILGLLRVMWRFNSLPFFVVIWLSNGIGMLGSYMLICMMEASYYSL